MKIIKYLKKTKSFTEGGYLSLTDEDVWAV